MTVASIGELKVCSVNCRGLGEYRKRRDVFNYLKALDCNVFLLQDIHCAKGRENSFRNLWGSDILLAPYRNNARGVGILTKNIDIRFVGSRIDDNGNYIIVKAIINQQFEIVITNIYGPNNDNPTFFENMQAICADMAEDATPILIAGDLNMALNSELDTYNYVRDNNVNARNCVLKIMQENNMIDVFRSLNGDLRRYTWRVKRPVVKQARLDYFIASDSLSPYIMQASIAPGYRTDHSMVILTMNLKEAKRGRGFFKFNCSLLTDLEYIRKMKLIIRETLCRYVVPVYESDFMNNNLEKLEFMISDSLLWETILLNIRTETVTYGIHKKRQSGYDEKSVLRQIAEAELTVQTQCTTDALERLERYKWNLEELRKRKLEGVILRSRARWYELGEKSTAYFLGLEKRNYLNKLIPSLQLESERITDQNEIIKTLENHFREVFRERFVGEEELDEFIQSLSMKQISQMQKEAIGRPIEMKELSLALQKMCNKRSPGSDGFPAEFLKFFWADLKGPYYRMILESFNNGELPLTLREGVICLIPKPQKPRDKISSYRPITLLNGGYKIISSAIANRFKSILPSIIGKEQTGFVSGRFVGDNTRLTYDLIEYLKAKGLYGLFLSLDIEGAFNSVSWAFVRKVLRKRNFPEQVIQWFNVLYVGSFSRLLYNGHISDKIDLQRSCRQGDPLSCYIFLVVIECLLERIRQNTSIRGIMVGDTEFKVSGYADDTLCFLDGSVNSCRALFNDLGIFAKFSGLKPNISKTEALWAGADVDEMPPICEDLSFRWVKKLKVLGVFFANNESSVFEDNFENRFNQVVALLNSWKHRDLTIKGKVIVVKSLLLPKFTHLFTSLPAPPRQFLDKLKQAMFSFIWGGKTDRIKRNSMYRPYNEGGLAMIEIEAYIAALKITWVRRYLITEHVWTMFFDKEIAQDEFLWNRNARSIANFARAITNKFWKETLFAYAKLTSTIVIDEMDCDSCSLWYSNESKFKQEEITQWKNRGLHNINDLLCETGRFLTFHEFKEKFDVRATSLDYLGLIQSLPRNLRMRHRSRRQPEPIIHPYVSNVLEKRQGAKQFYHRLIRDKYRQSQNTWEHHWEAEFGEVDWAGTYEAIYKGSTSVRLQMLNYKIITKISVTNRLLHHMGISEHDRCPRCNSHRDSIKHKFWECNDVRLFWTEVSRWLSSLAGVQRLIISKKMVILGVIRDKFVNHVVSLGKRVINENSNLSVGNLIVRINVDRRTEEEIARRNDKLAEFSKKWAALARLD